jgi:diguanylate cyclase (GGDEF)-like protein
MKSTNGTYFNGTRIDIATLTDGDKIQIGSATLVKFSYQDNLEVEFQAQLYQSAIKDGLTGAFNKRYFLDRMNEEFAYAHRHGSPLSLCLFDIDHFKKVNDTYGHQVGDTALVRLSGVVMRTIRREDIFCRYGGEEFAVILRDIGEQEALMFGERIRREVELCRIEGKEAEKQVMFGITVSLGVATLRAANFTKPEDFIAHADQNLYRAKQAGRNKTVG